MPHDKDRIGQRAGFIAKAQEHRERHLDNAKSAREQGNEKRAKWNEGRAATYDRQITQTAQNIKKISGNN